MPNCINCNKKQSQLNPGALCKKCFGDKQPNFDQVNSSQVHSFNPALTNSIPTMATRGMFISNQNNNNTNPSNVSSSGVNAIHGSTRYTVPQIYNAGENLF